MEESPDAGGSLALGLPRLAGQAATTGPHAPAPGFLDHKTTLTCKPVPRLPLSCARVIHGTVDRERMQRPGSTPEGALPQLAELPWMSHFLFPDLSFSL